MNCPYDIVVNPFWNKNWTSGLNPEHVLHNRFEYGIPPAKNDKGELTAKNVKDRLRDMKGDPDAAVDGENDRVSQALTGGRIKQLAERDAPTTAGGRGGRGLTLPRQRASEEDGVREVTDAKPRHRRHSIRLPLHDYSQPGAYFVTICAHGRMCLFGEVRADSMQLSPSGQLIHEAWEAISSASAGLTTGPFVVMPNHIHGIIEIAGTPVGAIHELPRHKLPQHKLPDGGGAASRIQRRNMLLPKIIGRYKMQTAKAVNQSRATPGLPVWQRNYYEYVIRDEADFGRIAEYIADIPRRWNEDALHPDNWDTHADSRP